MALLSPNNLSSTLPHQQKKGVFSSGSTSRRGSTSNVSLSSSPKIPQGIGYSPNSSQTATASPAGSGIPSFRTLRSLLPFGPSKNATLASTSTPPSSSKSHFSGFGSVRRSMTKERERKTSLSNDATPIISISRSQEALLADETAIRRSVSLSRLEKPLPMKPDFIGSSNLFRGDDNMLVSELGYVLRSPSPIQTLSAELSTIIEADSSGVSKHVPFLGLESTSTQSHSSPPPIIQRDLLYVELASAPRGESTFGRNAGASHTRQAELEADTSALELPTDELTDQVREAMRKSGSSTNSGKQWLSEDKDPVVIDADEHPDIADRTFNSDTVDPDLFALLSPNSGARNASSHSLPREVENSHISPSPTTPKFSSLSPASRLPRSRQASSFLPRLRSQNSPSPSPTSPRFSIPRPSPTRTSPSTITTPKATPLDPRTPISPMNEIDYPPNSLPPSPGPASSATSTPARRTMTRPTRAFEPSASSSSTPNPGSGRTNVFSGLMRSSDAKTPSVSTSNRLVPRALRQAMLGSSDRPRTANARLDATSPPSPTRTSTLGRGSLDSRRPPPSNGLMKDIGIGRPSLDISRSNSFEPRTHAHRSSTSPERTTSTDLDSSPSPEVPFPDESHYRPSFDSVRPSFETSSRPGSVARLRERERDNQRTPSLRVTDASGERMSPVPQGAPRSNRVRKRSMSVQERFPAAKGRLASASEHGSADMSRPGSSMSVHGGRGARDRAFGRDIDDGGSVSAGPGPKMEWLGPRTAKAFRAAGLLDFERNRDKDKDSDGSDTTERMIRNRSGSVGVPSPSPLGGGSGGPGGGGSLASNQGRFAMIRSASEYNPAHGRPHSRMAFSEVGGITSSAPARRGSGSFSAYGAGGNGGGSTYGYPGLMDSPTFTVSSSSRERDTPKSSTSTPPTSLSESFGYLGRDRVDREREREEVRELKERHATEMGALLSALSDSQRTARMLREENSQLRERFDRFSGVARENDDLRRTCDALENECMGLRGEYAELQRELGSMRGHRCAPGLAPSWSSSSIGSSLRTPIAKFGNSSPLSMDTTPQFLRQQNEGQLAGEEEVYNNTIIIHDSIDDDNDDDNTPQYGVEPHTRDQHDARGVIAPKESSSSLTPSHTRRLSNSSSIFPTVPSNMTMLLHEDSTSNLGLTDMNRTSADNSQFHFSFPASPTSAISITTVTTPQSKSHSRSLSKSPPITFRNFAGPGHNANKSITSTTSISPTTANFSMVTGSPGSLFLRPEHELLLGDMESLDLGVRGTDADSAHQMLGDDGW